MLKIYFIPRNADGTAIPSQVCENGTIHNGFADVAEAYQHTPQGGWVEKRYTDGKDDWPGDITAERGADDDEAGNDLLGELED